MVTVIIPALNEEKTIGSVIEFCFKHPLVDEVIVIDDQSADKTTEIAANAGARVIISQKRGKGISMQEGIYAAKNDVLVFLDADIDPYPSNTIHRLISPLIKGDADFVKACFSRNAGRVTELLAKPLLSLLFPDLVKYKQPLGGMIASRKSLLEKVEFVHDYGVDIAILIDVYQLGATIKEVNIGYIENKSKPWQALGRMSTEVAGAILFKALSFGVSTNLQLLHKPADLHQKVNV